MSDGRNRSESNEKNAKKLAQKKHFSQKKLFDMILLFNKYIEKQIIIEKNGDSRNKCDVEVKMTKKNSWIFWCERKLDGEEKRPKLNYWPENCNTIFIVLHRKNSKYTKKKFN